MISITRQTMMEWMWSRTAEGFFRRIGNLLSGVRRIPEEKTVLRKWIKSKVPLNEENWTIVCEFSVASLWLFFANYYSLCIPYVPKTVAVFKLCFFNAWKFLLVEFFQYCKCHGLKSNQCNIDWCLVANKINQSISMSLSNVFTTPMGNGHRGQQEWAQHYKPRDVV